MALCGTGVPEGARTMSPKALNGRLCSNMFRSAHSASRLDSDYGVVPLAEDIHRSSMASTSAVLLPVTASGQCILINSSMALCGTGVAEGVPTMSPNA